MINENKIENFAIEQLILFGWEYIHGSVFPEISKSVFKELEISIPPKYLLNKFNATIVPKFEKIKTNQTQIRTLTQLRDALLPKLMSGEVRVI